MSGLINSAGSESGVIGHTTGNISASGTSQTTRYINGCRYFEWTTSGTFVVTGTGTLVCDMLIVGGGGGGGYWGGCGGGGGAVYERFNYPFPAGTYTVTVGSGGTNAVIDTGVARIGANGSNSSIGMGTVLSLGFRGHIGFGGGGGGAAGISGLDGGCGGGCDDDTVGKVAGKGINHSDIEQGDTLNSQTITREHKQFSHASSPTTCASSSHNGGGGGGAGGMNGTYTEDSSPPLMTTQSAGGHGGHGGIGKYISWVDTFAGENDQAGITGTRGYFAAGGSGTTSQNISHIPGGSGTGTSYGGRNQTGGGSNGDKGSGASGGSGIVIVRYKL
jgi:hypothetical protein